MRLRTVVLVLLGLAACWLWGPSAWAQASLLPNGEQTFFDANGAPLAAGQVFFYIPSTTTFKNTWQDAGETVLNTNPVLLDAAGRAIIYGSGSYRQLVKDQFGNTVWDQLTGSAGAGGTTNIISGAGPATLVAGQNAVNNVSPLASLLNLPSTTGITTCVSTSCPFVAVKDLAGTFNRGAATVQDPVGQLIDGQTTYVMTLAWEEAGFQYYGSAIGWGVQ